MHPTTRPVPVLSDGLVTLRAPTMADVDGLVEQCTDPEMLRWTTVPRGYTREDAAGRVEQIERQWDDPHGPRSWVIEFDSGTGSGSGSGFGGAIDLRPGESPTTASVGFGLHPAARGRGLMTRAVRLVAAYAFETRPWGSPVGRVHWRAVVGNWASRRVAWAAGFTFHGTLPQTHVDPADPTGPALDTWNASLAMSEAMTARALWFTPPVLMESGIRLRPWRDGDVDAIEQRDDPGHWMPARSVLCRDTFGGWLVRRREQMAEGTAVEWCVADGATDRALGGVAIFSRGEPITGDVAELGYQLNPSARGRGAMKTAACLAVRHALAPTAEGGLGLRRVVAETAADNGASNTVLETNGFTAYGREHSVDVLPDGTYGDGIHWELLAPRADA